MKEELTRIQKCYRTLLENRKIFILFSEMRKNLAVTKNLYI